MESDLIRRFRAQHPGLRLEFVVSDRLLDLAGGEVDIAIRGHEPDRNDLFGRKLGETRWAIYAGAPYAERNGMPHDVTEIGDHPIYLFDVELTEHVTNTWLRSVAPNAQIGARCTSLTALAQAVRSGAGLAALPTIVGDREPGLIRVLGPLADLVTPFYILTHQDLKRTPRVRTFFDFIAGSAREVRSILFGQG